MHGEKHLASAYAQRFIMSDNSRLIPKRRPCRKACADLSSAVCERFPQYRAFDIRRSLISCLIPARRFEMWLASVMHTIIPLNRYRADAEQFVGALDNGTL